MDNTGNQLRPECLTCPLCLEAFKKPTLLRCGHTFCKVCLEGYDKEHHGVDHMECPVCRKRTRLDESRIAGLSPNFVVKGLQEELHVDEREFPNLCLLHKTEHKNFFCDDCMRFICITCFIKTHQGLGHKITKKEDLKEELKMKKVTLIERSKTKKQQIEKSVLVAEKKQKEIHGHCNGLEGEIKLAYDKKVATLQANKKKLVEAVNSIRRDSDKSLKSSIAEERLLIDSIDISVGILTANNSQPSSNDILREDYIHCCNLEQSLEKADDQQTSQAMEQVQVELNLKFLPANGKLLDLGLIETARSSTSNGQHSTPPQRNTYADEAQPSTSGTVGGIPAKVSGKGEGIKAKVPNNSLTMVKEVELSEGMYGMAAISQDSVVAGYGRGSYRISVSGEKKLNIHSEAGNVCDIACLSDGRTVASGFDSTCHVYDADGNLTDVQYVCIKKQAWWQYPKICIDNNNYIYAIDGSPMIRIFHGDSPNPCVEIPTSHIPYRICVTKTGTVIVCSSIPGKSMHVRRTVTAYDRDGTTGTIIKSNNVVEERLYAAVDSQDRVLVARTRNRTDMLRLARYTLEGVTFTKEKTFKTLRLPRPISRFISDCYMASLAPNLLAFSDRAHVYFIKLAV